MSVMTSLVDSIINSVSVNFEIIAAFVAALFVYRKNTYRYTALIVVLVCLLPDSFFGGSYKTLNSYCLMTVIFICHAIMLSLCKNFLPALAVVALAMYCAVFAADTWVNANVETWLYINHEIIITSLYLAVLLSFSARVSALVVACFSYIITFSNNHKPYTPDCDSDCGR